MNIGKSIAEDLLAAYKATVNIIPIVLLKSINEKIN